MKTLIALCFFLLVIATFAGTMILDWNGSPTAGVTAYRIYVAADTNFTTQVLEFDLGNVNTATIQSASLHPGNWYVAGTAFVGDDESAFSAISLLPAYNPTVIVKYFRSPTMNPGDGVEFDEKAMVSTNLNATNARQEFYWLQVVRP